MGNVRLSVCVPTIRPNNWKNCIENIAKSCLRYEYEIVFVGPNPNQDFLNQDKIKYVQEYGSPTRAIQVAALNCSGEYFCVPSDDGTFFESSLDYCIDLHSQALNYKDVIIMRYREGPSQTGQINSYSYYIVKHNHGDFYCQYLPDDWKFAMQPFVNLSYFKEIGGIDCRFEHLGYSWHDFSYRVQRDGGLLHFSPTEVMNIDWMPGLEGDHAPVHFAHNENDRPLFLEIYSDEGVVNRKKIDYNNYINADPVWKRRWGVEVKK